MVGERGKIKIGRPMVFVDALLFKMMELYKILLLVIRWFEIARPISQTSLAVVAIAGHGVCVCRSDFVLVGAGELIPQVFFGHKSLNLRYFKVFDAIGWHGQALFVRVFSIL